MFPEIACSATGVGLMIQVRVCACCHCSHAANPQAEINTPRFTPNPPTSMPFDIITFGEAMVRLSPEFTPARTGEQPRFANRRRGTEHRGRPRPARTLRLLDLALPKTRSADSWPIVRHPMKQVFLPSTWCGPTRTASASTSWNSAPRPRASGATSCTTARGRHRRRSARHGRLERRFCRSENGFTSPASLPPSASAARRLTLEAAHGGPARRGQDQHRSELSRQAVEPGRGGAMDGQVHAPVRRADHDRGRR